MNHRKSFRNKNAKNQNYPKIPPKEKTESEKNKNREQNKLKQIQNKPNQKRCEEASVIWGLGGKTRKDTDEITPGSVDRVECVMRSCDTMRVMISKEWDVI